VKETDMLWNIRKVLGLALGLTLVAVTSPWWMTLCVSGGVLALMNEADDEDEVPRECDATRVA
jgi:hypothetical protein